MEAIILIGIQGSGKSTFYRRRFFDTHVRINLDMLRTRRREQLLLAACLEGGQRFLVDNTNAAAADRARYIAPARAAHFKLIAYFFRVTLREAIARNAQRAGKQKVPIVALAATLKKLEPPSIREGFHIIYNVRVTPDGEFEVTPGP